MMTKTPSSVRGKGSKLARRLALVLGLAGGGGIVGNSFVASGKEGPHGFHANRERTGNGAVGTEGHGLTDGHGEGNGFASSGTNIGGIADGRGNGGRGGVSNGLDRSGFLALGERVGASDGVGAGGGISESHGTRGGAVDGSAVGNG